MKIFTIIFLIFFQLTAFTDNYRVKLSLINVVDLPALPVDMAVNGNFAYLVLNNGGSGVIAAVDLTTPDNIPQFRLFDANVSDPKLITMSGSYAYISDKNNTIRVFNFNSSNYFPVNYGQVRTSSDVNKLYCANGYLYTATKDLGLQVYDISLPSMPLLKNTQIVSGDPVGLFVDNKYAYITSSNGNMTIIDVSNISNLPVAGKYTLGYNYFNVYVSEGYAYIAQGQNGVQVVDAKKLPSPKAITMIYSRKNATDVLVNGYYTWVNDQLTLQAYYNKDVESQQYAGSYDNMGADILKFYVTDGGKYVYVCSGDKYLKILKAEYY